MKFYVLDTQHHPKLNGGVGGGAKKCERLQSDLIIQKKSQFFVALQILTSSQFWPLDSDVEVYVYADAIIYSYQLTIPQHS